MTDYIFSYLHTVQNQEILRLDKQRDKSTLAYFSIQLWKFLSNNNPTLRVMTKWTPCKCILQWNLTHSVHKFFLRMYHYFRFSIKPQKRCSTKGLLPMKEWKRRVYVFEFETLFTKKTSGFLPGTHLKWVRSCLRKLPDSTKDFLHTLQTNGRSPLWMRSCACQLPDWLNRFGQNLHLYGRSPVWTRSCIFKELLAQKTFPQNLHGYSTPRRLEASKTGGFELADSIVTSVRAGSSDVDFDGADASKKPVSWKRWHNAVHDESLTFPRASSWRF